MSAKPGGSRPRLARSYTAGMSFLRARSPVIPKITRADGPAMRFRRRSAGTRSGLLPGPSRGAFMAHASIGLRRGTRPARGADRVPGMRSGGLERLGDGVRELVPRRDELVDGLALEQVGDLVEVDARG